MTPMAQMAIVAAVKTFAPETLVAMVFDLYENGQVSDQTLEIVKGLPEGEVVRRFVGWVNSPELPPLKEKLFTTAQLLRRELSANDGQQQTPPDTSADAELQAVLAGAVPAAPVTQTTIEVSPAPPA